MLLPGRPSDGVDDVLATGSGDITTTFVSMATRHPDGTEADYLHWHTLDHRARAAPPKWSGTEFR